MAFLAAFGSSFVLAVFSSFLASLWHSLDWQEKTLEPGSWEIYDGGELCMIIANYTLTYTAHCSERFQREDDVYFAKNGIDIETSTEVSMYHTPNFSYFSDASSLYSQQLSLIAKGIYNSYPDNYWTAFCVQMYAIYKCIRFGAIYMIKYVATILAWLVGCFKYRVACAHSWYEASGVRLASWARDHSFGSNDLFAIFAKGLAFKLGTSLAPATYGLLPTRIFTQYGGCYSFDLTGRIRDYDPVTDKFKVTAHNLAPVGVRCCNDVPGVCVFGVSDGHTILPMGQATVGENCVLTATHVLRKAKQFSAQGMKILVTAMVSHISASTKWFEVSPMAFLGNGHHVGYDEYKEVTSSDISLLFFRLAACRLRKAKAGFQIADQYVGTASCYHYRKAALGWDLYISTGETSEGMDLEPLNRPSPGLVTHDCESIPGVSGGPMFTPDNRMCGMMLGVIGDQKLAMHGTQVKYFTSKQECFSGQSFDWPKHRLPEPDTIPHTLDDTSVMMSDSDGKVISKKELRVVKHGTHTFDDKMRELQLERDQGTAQMKDLAGYDRGPRGPTTAHTFGELPPPPLPPPIGAPPGLPKIEGKTKWAPKASEEPTYRSRCDCCRASHNQAELGAFCPPCSSFPTSEPTSPVFTDLDNTNRDKIARGKLSFVQADDERTLNDSTGRTMLKVVARIAGMNKPGGSKMPKPRQEYIDLAAERDVNVQDYTMPDTSSAGVFSSFTANCAKRTKRDKPNDEGLASYLSSQCLPKVTSHEENRDLDAMVSYAMTQVDGTKVGGWTSLTTGIQTKGDIISLYGPEIKAAAIKRLELLIDTPCGEVAVMSATALVQNGLRDPVVPNVKPEPHPRSKVFDKAGQRLKDPRWRSILVQSLIDELVGRVAHKPYNSARIEQYQTADIEHVVRGGSTLGAGQHDNGILRLGEAIHGSTKLIQAEEVVVECSDVSGMDWCCDQYHCRADFMVRRAANVKATRALYKEYGYKADPTEWSWYDSLLCNYSLVTAAPCYVIGDLLVAQCQRGVNQSGVVSTGPFNCHARAVAEHEYVWAVYGVRNWDGQVFLYRAPLAHGDDCTTARRKDDKTDVDLFQKVTNLGLRDVVERDVRGPYCYLSMEFSEGSPVYTFLNEAKCIVKLAYAKLINADTFQGLRVVARYTPKMLDWVLIKFAKHGGLAGGNVRVVPSDYTFDVTAGDP